MKLDASICMRTEAPYFRHVTQAKRVLLFLLHDDLIPRFAISEDHVHRED